MTGRLIPLLLIVVAIGLFFVYINPTYNNTIMPLKAEIQQYNSTLAAAADFNKKEAQLGKDKSAIPQDGIDRLQSYLPDGVDNVQLILDLNALAARSGMQLSNFSIATGEEPGSNTTSPVGGAGSRTVESLDLNVKALGTYTAFRTFLAGVEQSLRPLDLVNLSVTTSPTGVYSFDMTFRIYWLHS